MVEDIPIPEMRNLTDAQVKIIKTTWEIPAAKVSFGMKADEREKFN